MSRLFKQQITRYVDEQGRRCSKNTPGAKQTVEESAKWYGQFKDKNNRWRRVALSTDKEVSKKRLAQLVATADSGKFKLTDPFAEHRKRKLTEHLDDYAIALHAKDRRAEYVSKQVQRIRDSAKGCGFEYLHDIDELKLAAYLKQRRRGGASDFAPTKDEYTTTEVAKLLGMSPQAVFRLAQRHDLPREGKGRKMYYAAASVVRLLDLCGRGISTSSSNGYAVAFKGFTRWLVRNRRLEDDPLKGLETLNAKKDRRHPRRVLSTAEVQKFLEATSEGVEYLGLSGSDRVVLYSVAIYTGFRASELAALTPSNFDLDGGSVSLPAAVTKNGRDASIPLRGELTSMLRGYLRNRPSTRSLWSGRWSETAAEMIRIDLHRAGIPYRNEQLEVFDFHSLRRQFVAGLVQGKVHPKVAQLLARHSTIQMTMDVYAELREGNELATAIEAMPGYHKLVTHGVTQTEGSSGQDGAVPGSDPSRAEAS